MTNAANIALLGAGGFIVTALILAASPARSEPPVDVIAKSALTRHVPYGDLSLASEQGRRILYRRVASAVQEVCPPTEDDGSWYDVPDCQQFAWRGARPQMRRAFDLAKSGSSLAMSSSITISVAK